MVKESETKPFTVEFMNKNTPSQFIRALLKCPTFLIKATDAAGK